MSVDAIKEKYNIMVLAQITSDSKMILKYMNTHTFLINILYGFEI